MFTSAGNHEGIPCVPATMSAPAFTATFLLAALPPNFISPVPAVAPPMPRAASNFIKALRPLLMPPNLKDTRPPFLNSISSKDDTALSSALRNSSVAN